VEKAFGRRKDGSLRLAEKHVRAVQIIPTALGRLMRDNNAGQSTERDEGDFEMDKIDIARLQQATIRHRRVGLRLS
jgi:hypothetical protein